MCNWILTVASKLSSLKYGFCYHPIFYVVLWGYAAMPGTTSLPSQKEKPVLLEQLEVGIHRGQCGDLTNAILEILPSHTQEMHGLHLALEPKGPVPALCGRHLCPCQFVLSQKILSVSTTLGEPCADQNSIVFTECCSDPCHQLKENWRALHGLLSCNTLVEYQLPPAQVPLTLTQNAFSPNLCEM